MCGKLVFEYMSTSIVCAFLGYLCVPDSMPACTGVTRECIFDNEDTESKLLKFPSVSAFALWQWV